MRKFRKVFSNLVETSPDCLPYGLPTVERHCTTFEGWFAIIGVSFTEQVKRSAWIN